MANHHRGSVDLDLPSGRLTLCLTFGALAEIETALGAGDLVALGERLQTSRLSARDIIVILGAAVRGGGQDLTDRTLAERLSAADAPAAVAAIGQLFAATFGDGS